MSQSIWDQLAEANVQDTLNSAPDTFEQHLQEQTLIQRKAQDLAARIENKRKRLGYLQENNHNQLDNMGTGFSKIDGNYYNNANKIYNNDSAEHKQEVFGQAAADGYYWDASTGTYKDNNTNDVLHGSIGGVYHTSDVNGNNGLEKLGYYTLNADSGMSPEEQLKANYKHFQGTDNNGNILDGGYNPTRDGVDGIILGSKDTMSGLEAYMHGNKQNLQGREYKLMDDQRVVDHAGRSYSEIVKAGSAFGDATVDGQKNPNGQYSLEDITGIGGVAEIKQSQAPSANVWERGSAYNPANWARQFGVGLARETYDMVDTVGDIGTGLYSRATDGKMRDWGGTTAEKDAFERRHGGAMSAEGQYHNQKMHQYVTEAFTGVDLLHPSTWGNIKGGKLLDAIGEGIATPENAARSLGTLLPYMVGAIEKGAAKVVGAVVGDGVKASLAVDGMVKAGAEVTAGRLTAEEAAAQTVKLTAGMDAESVRIIAQVAENTQVIGTKVASGAITKDAGVKLAAVEADKLKGVGQFAQYNAKVDEITAGIANKTMSQEAGKAAKDAAWKSLTGRAKIAVKSAEILPAVTYGATIENQSADAWYAKHGTLMDATSLITGTMVNTVFGTFDIKVTKDILAGVKNGATFAKALKESVKDKGKLKEIGAFIASGLVTLSADAGKEMGQEFIQSWGEAFTSNLNGIDSIKDAATSRSTLVQAGEGAVAAPGVAIHMAGAGKAVRAAKDLVKGPDEETKKVNAAKKETILYNQDTVDTKHKELDQHLEDGSFSDAVATYKDVRDNADEKIKNSSEHIAKMDEYKAKVKELGAKVKEEIASRDSKDVLGSTEDDKKLFDSLIASDMLTGAKADDIVKTIEHAADKLNVNEYQVDNAIQTVTKIDKLKKVDPEAAKNMENLVLSEVGKAKVSKAQVENSIKETTAELDSYDAIELEMNEDINKLAGEIGEGDTSTERYANGRAKLVEQVKAGTLKHTVTVGGTEYSIEDAIRVNLMHEKPKKDSIQDKRKKTLDKMDLIREIEDSNHFELSNSTKYLDNRKNVADKKYKYTQNDNEETKSQYESELEQISKHAKTGTYKETKKAYKKIKEEHDRLNNTLKSMWVLNKKHEWKLKKGKYAEAESNQVSKGKKSTKSTKAQLTIFNDSNYKALQDVKKTMSILKTQLAKKDKKTSTEKATVFAKAEIKKVKDKRNKVKEKITKIKAKYKDTAQTADLEAELNVLADKEAKLTDASKEMINTYSKAEKVSKGIKDLNIEDTDKYYEEHKKEIQELLDTNKKDANKLAKLYVKQEEKKRAKQATKDAKNSKSTNSEKDAKAYDNQTTDKQATEDAKAHTEATATEDAKAYTEATATEDAKAYTEEVATMEAAFMGRWNDLSKLDEEALKKDAINDIINKTKDLSKKLVDSETGEIKLSNNEQLQLEAEQVKEALDATVLELHEKQKALEQARVEHLNDTMSDEELAKVEKAYKDLNDKIAKESPVKNMLDTSYANSDKLSGMLDKDTAALRTFDMINEKTHSGSVLATINLEEGSNPKLVAIANKVIKDFEGELTASETFPKSDRSLLSSKFNDPSLFLLYNDKGEMDKNAALVMKAALEDFMATTAGRMTYNDQDKVRKMVEAVTNQSNDEVGDTSVYFQDGEIMKNVLEPLTNTFLRGMGLSINKGMKGSDYNKVIATLGFKMVQLGMSAGYFERVNADNAGDKGSSTVLSVVKELGFTEAHEDATMMMLRVKGKEVSDRFETVDRAKENTINKILVDLLEGEATESGPQFAPPLPNKNKNKQKKIAKGEKDQFISDIESIASDKFEHQEFNLDMAGMQTLIDMDEKQRNDLLGIQELTDEDKKRLTARSVKTIESKNAKSLQEWTDLLALHAKIESGEVNNAMWFKLFTSRNMRTTIRSNTINPATVKLHRFLVRPKIKDEKANTLGILPINASRSTQHADMYKAIASGLGIGIDKTNTFISDAIGKKLYEMTDKELDEIQTQLLNGEPKVEISGIDLDAKSVEKYNNKVREYNKDRLDDKYKDIFKEAKEVDATKEITAELKIEELSHMVATIAELKRKNKAVKDGETKFVPNFQVEIDGTSNGVGHKSLQQIEGYAGANLRRLGIYVGDAVPASIHGMNSIDANKLMQDLDAYENLASATEAAKPDWMTQEAYNVLENYLPQFNNIEGAIDKLARTMAKPSLMQTGYGAFVSTVKRTLGYDVMYGKSNSGKISDMDMEQQILDEARFLHADLSKISKDKFEDALNTALKGKDGKPMLISMIKGMLPSGDQDTWIAMLETITEGLTEEGKTLDQLTFKNLGFNAKDDQEKTLINNTDAEQKTTTMGDVNKLKTREEWNSRATLGNYITSAISDIYAAPLVESLYETYGDTFKSNRLMQNSTTAMGTIFIAAVDDVVAKEAKRLGIAEDALTVAQVEEIVAFVMNDAIEGEDGNKHPGMGLVPGFRAAGKGSYISTIDKDKDTSKLNKNGSATTNAKKYDTEFKAVSILAKKYTTVTQSPLVLSTQSSDATNMAELIADFSGELVNVFDAIVVKSGRASEASSGFNEKFLNVALDYNMPAEVLKALDRMVTNATPSMLLEAEKKLDTLDEIHQAKDGIPKAYDINYNVATDTEKVSSLKQIYAEMTDFVNENNRRKKDLLLGKKVTVSQFAFSDEGVFTTTITEKMLEPSKLDAKLSADNFNSIGNEIPEHVNKMYEAFKTTPNLTQMELDVVSELEITEREVIASVLRKAMGQSDANASASANEMHNVIINMVLDQRFEKYGNTKVKLDTILSKGSNTLTTAISKDRDGDLTVNQAKALRDAIENINERTVYYYAIDKKNPAGDKTEIEMKFGNAGGTVVPKETFNNAVARGRSQFDIDQSNIDEEDKTNKECGA